MIALFSAWIRRVESRTLCFLVWILVFIVLTLVVGACERGWIAILVEVIASMVTARACKTVGQAWKASLQTCPREMFALKVVFPTMTPASTARRRGVRASNHEVQVRNASVQASALDVGGRRDESQAIFAREPVMRASFKTRKPRVQGIQGNSPRHSRCWRADSAIGRHVERDANVFTKRRRSWYLQRVGRSSSVG